MYPNYNRFSVKYSYELRFSDHKKSAIYVVRSMKEGLLGLSALWMPFTQEA